MKDLTIFMALADPTRRQILLDLAKDSPKTATEFAKVYPISRPGIIKHLNILEEAGLVKIYQKGRDKRYVFTPEPLNELQSWLEEINTVWLGNLLRIKDLVEGDKSEE